ncbi:MAG: hypothetical protein Tsb009_12820 [Planctomycetaceae bacterium]
MEQRRTLPAGIKLFSSLVESNQNYGWSFRAKIKLNLISMFLQISVNALVELRFLSGSSHEK